jgi:hypothetical protein
MPDPDRVADHGEVENAVVVIHLELRLAGESLTGRAFDDHGTAHRFDGRLGLLSAIDALIAPESGGAPPRETT